MHRELPANALPGVRSPLASHVTTGTSEVPSVKQLGTESTDHRGRTGRRLTVQEARPPPSRENPRLWVDAPRLGQKTENKHRTSDETGEFACGRARLRIVGCGSETDGREG